MKSAIVASLAFGAAVAAFAPATGVSAQSIQLDLNNGRIGIAPDAPPPRYRRPPAEFERAGISCGEGGRIVRANGFRNVRPVNCNGRAYTYVGQRRGEPFEVRVSALNGAIIDIAAY